jgi:homoserine O-acetyltransferase
VIDPADFRVLSFDFLGGPGWSTGPGRELVGSGDTGVEGEPSRGDDARVASRRRFPAVTPLDQANALSLLLDALRIPCVHAVVGSSYGGMVGVAFAARHPARTERLVAISGTHATHPMATALRALQRRILRLGLSVGVESEAVALSRALAMTTYRSASEFRERFDTRASWEEESGWASFPAEEYVLARGRSFSDRFSAHEFLALSESLDLHRVDPTPIQAATTIVSVEGDPIAPEWQAEELARAIGGNARGFTLSSRFGHDAFLKEPELLAPIIRSALDGGARGATVEIGR